MQVPSLDQSAAAQSQGSFKTKSHLVEPGVGQLPVEGSMYMLIQHSKDYGYHNGMDFSWWNIRPQRRGHEIGAVGLKG